MKYLNKQLTAIASILIFSIGLMLSSNVFADKPSSKTLPNIPAERFETTLKVCANSENPQWEPCFYEIGHIGPAGGIVFYVTDSGLHGLEAAPMDPEGGSWGCYRTEITGADGTAVGTGAQNTVDILAGCNDPEKPPEAAELADNYVLNGYTDWFLPSLDEVIAMYQSPDLQSSFGVWSSTESADPNFGPDEFAMSVHFSSGLIAPDPKNVPYQAWPIRAF